jgi:RNA polymerase sigma-70 factor, ECF subfamily
MLGLLRKAPAAASELYDRYASRIYGLGIVLLKNRTEAEDLVQDTFLKVWRRATTYDPDRGSLDGWVLLIARSLALDVLRRRTLEARIQASELQRSEVSDEPGPEQHAEHRDLMERAREAMHRLPPGQRRAVELAYLGHRTGPQVAEMEGIPLGTIKSRIRHGILSLREALREVDTA